MASLILKRRSASALGSVADSLRIATSSRTYASFAVGSGKASAAPDLSPQKPRIGDDAVSSKLSTTSVEDIFKGKEVVNFGIPGSHIGVSSQQNVPSYKNNVDKFKAKGINNYVCASVNNPYVMNARAEKLRTKDAVNFYGDFVRRFHKSLDLQKDRSETLDILRPLSPHLPIYQPQLNATFSIYHRITGSLLSGIVLFYYLLCMKMGSICFTYESFYQFFFHFYSSKLILISGEITALALAYHVFHGVRHLLTDFSGTTILRIGRNILK